MEVVHQDGGGGDQRPQHAAAQRGLPARQANAECLCDQTRRVDVQVVGPDLAQDHEREERHGDPARGVPADQADGIAGQLGVDGGEEETEKPKQDHGQRHAQHRPQRHAAPGAGLGQVTGVVAGEGVPRSDQREADHEAFQKGRDVGPAGHRRPGRPVHLAGQGDEQQRREGGERERPEGLEDLDGGMSVDGHRHAHGCDQKHPDEGRGAAVASQQARPGLGGDHAVDGKPAHRQEQREEGADPRPAQAENPAREHDLGLAGGRPGVAEQAQHKGAGHSAQDGGQQAIPDAEPEGAGQEAGGEQAGVVDEGAGPEEGQLPRPSVALARGHPVDAPGLHSEELVRSLRTLDGRVHYDTSLRRHYPDQVQRSAIAHGPLSRRPGSRVSRTRL